MKTFCEVNDFLICRKGLDFFLISSLKFIVKLFVGAFWRDFPEGTSNIGRLIFTAGHSLSLFKTQRTALAKTFDFFFLYSALCCDPLKQARHISSVSFPSHTVLPYAPQSPYILPFCRTSYPSYQMSNAWSLRVPDDKRSFCYTVWRWAFKSKLERLQTGPVTEIHASVFYLWNGHYSTLSQRDPGKAGWICAVTTTVPRMF